MGCDIHLFGERRVDGKWESVDEWVTEDFAGYIYTSVKRDARLYDGRNYDLFAILANVRNGYGFAGVLTGTGFIPISEPRGLPTDVSPEVKANSMDWGGDGHSHSWLTLRELLDYDWNQTTMKVGVVDVERYIGNREGPYDNYCGWISGPSVNVMPVDKAQLMSDDELRDAASHVQVLWPQTYRERAEHFLTTTIPKLEALGSPDDVRIVFWFDN